jgi:hypothetical protein
MIFLERELDSETEFNHQFAVGLPAELHEMTSQ